MFKKKIYQVGALVATGLAVAGQTFASYATDASTAVSGAIDEVADIIWANLPTVLLLVGALIALMFVVRFVKKQIGRAK